MHLICKACPNGCALQLTRRDDTTVLVRGNHCARGVAYAYAEKKEEWPGQFLPAEQPERYSREALLPVLKAWGLVLERIDPNALIQGSPERSAFRVVVADSQGKSYLLETVLPYSCDRRKRIAACLRRLREKALPVIPYAPGLDGDFVQHVAGKYWQLSDFVAGEALDRTAYWRDGWRGAALADFLADLSANTLGDAWSAGPAFSLPAYIDRLLQTISSHRPQLLGELGDVVAFLKRELYPIYDSIPQRFSHGDPHPMNVLWGADRIRAVIDWEFSGLRPLVYDAALVLGCVGAEAPGALDGAFLEAFRLRLRERGVFAPEFYDRLPLFTLAQRFAWLSEWLRRNDVEMIEFECFYMNLLRRRIDDASVPLP